MREHLLSCFSLALEAADPARLVPAAVPTVPAGRTLVVGGGKAAASMALAVESAWPTDAPLSGQVVTRYSHGLPTRRIEVIEASHPLPDGRGAEAAQSMLDEISRLSVDDHLLVLLSGGGSSLLALPVDRVSLDDLRMVTKSLLHSGASIQEINTVRKHLTRFSAGQVAVECAAPITALIISDVVGNDPSHIASGPCAPDASTFYDVMEILRRYQIRVPDAAMQHFQRGLSGDLADTPKPENPAFRKVFNRIIGSASRSLHAASVYLKEHGFHVVQLGEIEDDAHEVARCHARLAKQERKNSTKPVALLSGGETTVKVTNPDGRGGRNTEYLLALGLALKNQPGYWAIACDTDGIDGTQENAGAILCASSLDRAMELGLVPEHLLASNHAYDLFKALGDLVITGPTRTNVNDFRLILIA